MGRFPAELPEDLPDEQITLMVSYLEVLAEDREEARQGSTHSRRDIAAGRRAEAELEAAIADAWTTSRPSRR